jgi:Collagen triple helix repeat (20 copies)
MTTISQLPKVTTLNDNSLFLVTENGISKTVLWSYVRTNIIGYTGSRAATGYNGSIGPLGYTGSAAYYTGSVGTGVIGYTGSRGYTGSSGELGYVGSRGLYGYTGSLGPIGSQGIVGSQGTFGYTGSAGASLSIASDTVLGGIKVGSGLSINSSTGILSSVAGGYVLLAATAQSLGGVKQGGTNIAIANDGVISATIPVATTNSLGGVKAGGTNIAIANDGVISSSIPIATANALGGIKIGTGLTINPATGVVTVSYIGSGGATTLAALTDVNITTPTDGQVLKYNSSQSKWIPATDLTGGGGGGGGISLTSLGASTNSTPSGSGALNYSTSTGIFTYTPPVIPQYTLPIATTGVLGGVKQGTNITIDAYGVISATAYTLPVATTNSLGGVKQGTNITIDSYGTISATSYTLPTATSGVLGGIKLGSGLNIDANGIVSISGGGSGYSLPTATSSVLGGVKQGANVIIAADGTISVAATYALPIATSTVLGGVKINGNGLTVDVAGLLKVSNIGILSGLTDVSITNAAANEYLKYNGTSWVNSSAPGGTGGATALSGLTDILFSGTPVANQVLKYNGTKWYNGVDSTGSGAGLTSRSAVSGQTGSINNNASANFTITGFKTYVLFKVTTSAAAWVRIYTDDTSRTADASRLQGADPVPGNGVIAEVITTGAVTQAITPGTIGYNADLTLSNNIYLSVTNLSGSVANITVTLSVLQLEA